MGRAVNNVRKRIKKNMASGGTSSPSLTSPADGITPSSGSKSWSMAMVVYGVKKKFPSVRNTTCEEVHAIKEDPKTLILVLDNFACPKETI